MSAPGGGPGGNLYQKYTTRNPLARLLTDRFLGELDGLVTASGARRALEVGCGEGFLSLRLAALGLEVLATEPDAGAAEEAQERLAPSAPAVQFLRAAVEELDPARHAAPLVVCCEVLEHVRDPEGAVDRLADLAAPWLVASVPREPLWRVLNVARGAYWADWGNTPGHLHHWSKRAFLGLLGRRFEPVAVRSPLPWTLVLGRVRERGR